MSNLAPRLILSSLVRQCKPKTRTSVRHPTLRNSKRPSQTCTFHSAGNLRQDSYAQRYGPANEPQIPPPDNPVKALPSSGRSEPQSQSQPDKSSEGDEKSADSQQGSSQPAEESKGGEHAEDTHKQDLDELKDYENMKRSGTPLDIVLKTPPPSVRHGGHKAPHLSPPPYVHHFDTYTLVRDLAQGGYSEQQSIIIMKGVRAMLAENLDLARETLVSKSDVENETYLFQAACSELRTSLQTSRHSEMQTQRSQRAQLQHDYDILNQKVTQDMLSLREELKAMFNDRKMASQDEKRKLDAKIQQLNYEITVTLNSDSKSQVEGLRWVLTRRAAIAIGAAAFMIIASLNYSSVLNREREEAEKHRTQAREAAEKAQTEARLNPASQVDQGTQTKTEGDIAESLG